jgi:hypothetical protein
MKNFRIIKNSKEKVSIPLNNETDFKTTDDQRFMVE